MKKSILLFCLLICACWTARSQQKESPENLIKQENIEDYKQYVGNYLTAIEDATLYAAEPQIIGILEPFDFKSQYKKRSRTFTFNKIRTHLYKAIVKEIDVLTKDKDKQLTTINTPLLKCKTAGCKFEIIDVIRWDEFRQIVNPFIEKSQQEELALKKEIWNLKVPKKLRIQDAEPKIYPSSWMGFSSSLPNDYPVFVLQDDEDNICYWVSPLKTTSYTTDELVFEPYLNYLKKHYINVKYFDKTGKKYQINELYADPDSHAICVRFATSSKMRLETLKSQIASKELMLLDDYKTYTAEQERLRQIAEEKAQKEALLKQEKVRQGLIEIKRYIADQKKLGKDEIIINRGMFNPDSFERWIKEIFENQRMTPYNSHCLSINWNNVSIQSYDKIYSGTIKRISLVKKRPDMKCSIPNIPFGYCYELEFAHYVPGLGLNPQIEIRWRQIDEDKNKEAVKTYYIKKYGNYYGELISEGRVELGMTKEMLFCVKDVYLISQSISYGTRIEIYEKSGNFWLGTSATWYRFENNKLVSIY